MANNFRGNDALGKMNFLGNVIRDVDIRGTVIRANDFRGTDPYPFFLHRFLKKVDFFTLSSRTPITKLQISIILFFFY
jgi:hypothetical protein